MQISELKPEYDLALADLIRDILKKSHLDIPGTAYYDENLNHLSEFYSADPDRRYYYVVTDERGKAVGGFHGVKEIILIFFHLINPEQIRSVKGQSAVIGDPLQFPAPVRPNSLLGNDFDGHFPVRQVFAIENLSVSAAPAVGKQFQAMITITDFHKSFRFYCCLR